MKRVPRALHLKQVISLALNEAVYVPTERRFQKQLTDIITTNSAKEGFFHNSFSYKGEFYNWEFTTPRFKNQYLVPELHPSMDAYLADKKHLEYTEKPFIFGFFNRVLNASNSVLDYYELLPGCIHRPLTQLNLPAECILPREMTDEQVEAFKLAHADWIMMLKKRMVLDLVL